MNAFLLLLPLAAIDPNVWIYGTCFFATLCLVFGGLWAYNRRESRRRRAADLANELAGWGLTKFSHALSCYAIGDYSGFLSAIKDLVEAIRAEGLPAVFQTFFEKLLAHFVKDASWREKIGKQLSAAAVADGSAVAAAVSQIQTVAATSSTSSNTTTAPAA